MAQALALSGNEITDIVRLAGIQGDGRVAPDYSIGIYEATTNVAPYSSFETNTVGWTSVGATISRDTSVFKFGSASLKVVCPTGAGDAAYMSTAATVTNGSLYTCSMYVIAPAGTLLYLRITDLVATEFARYPFVATGVLQRVQGTAVANANGTMSAQMYCNTGQGPVTFWIDAIQIENKSVATPYVHTDGAPATRNVGQIQASSSFINSTQSWIMAKVRPAWASTDDPHAPTNAAHNLTVFEWGVSSGTRIRVSYDAQGGGIWYIERQSGGGGGTLTKTAAFAKDSLHTLIVTWTGTTIRFSLNNAAFDSISDSTIPDFTGYPTFELGSGGSIPAQDHREWNGDFLAFCAGTGVLTTNDIAVLNNSNLIANSKGIVSGLASLLSGGAVPTLLAPMRDAKYNYAVPPAPTGLIRV